MLTFSYTVVAGNTSADLDYATTAALALNGGSINDSASNTATLTLASPAAAGSLGANKNLVIDGNAPAVSAVSSSLANGTYATGTVVPVTVTFNKAVTVTGTPRLTLTTGSPATTAVSYTSGSGTNTLTFTYTVASGNNSPDLDYASTSALTLNGGTIKDTTGNGATLTLAAPGSAGSLAASKNLLIDTLALTITSKTDSPPQNTTSLSGTGGVSGQTITVQICATNSFPCAGGNLKATVTATAQLDGTWTTTAASKLGTGPFFSRATATTPSKTSAVFSFTNT
jgi:hypothetical protein